MAVQEPSLNKEGHVKYWRRCHQSFLPTPYTASDSTRLTFACFIVSALDLLSAPFTQTERNAIRTWVLSLQHPDGGFCGSSTHAFGGQDAGKGTANLAATFFALILLATAADGDSEATAAFTGVQRDKLLRWLRRLQRKDGSFGQNLWEGQPVGGSDMRHSYLASSVRWMLGAGQGPEGQKEDIDVVAMISHIRRGLTYDGGLAGSFQNESNCGYAYCGTAALAMADRDQSAQAIDKGVTSRQELLKFLAQRQFPYMAEAEAADYDEENLLEASLQDLSLEDGCKHVGYNGRWNKKADTCYCWWAVGTLTLLDQSTMASKTPSRRFLLEITQHRIGGFSKAVGGPPDIFHSYLGLAALAIFGEDGLKELDVGLCCSKETTRKIVRARESLLKSKGGSGAAWSDDGFWDAMSKS